mgnify:CR=1 FL=1
MIGLLYNLAEAKKIVNKNSMMKWMYIYSAVKLAAVVIAAFTSNYYAAVYILYLMWLMVMAYVDYYTGYVYVKMEYAVMVPELLCILCLMCSQNSKEYIEATAVSVCMVSVLLKVSSKAGWFGEGDCDVLICSSVFLSTGTALYSEGAAEAVHIIMDSMVVNMLYISISGFLFLLRYIKSVKLKTFSLKARKPFIPSIYMTGVVFLLYFICLDSSVHI